MKKNQIISVRAKCPYYHKHDGSRIFCSGIGGALTTMQYFETAKQRRAYMYRVCGSDWTKCGIAEINRQENEK